MTLDDLERRKSRHFAFFRRFPFFCWPNTSQSLNIEEERKRKKERRKKSAMI